MGSKDALNMSLDELISAKSKSKAPNPRGGGGGGGGAMRRKDNKSGGRAAPYQASGGPEMEKRGRGTFRFGGGGGGGDRRVEVVPSRQAGNSNGHAVHVGNLPFSVDWRELKEHMGGADAGVLRVDLATRPDGSSRGFATVQLASAKAVRTAIADLNESDLQGRSITVKEDEGRDRGNVAAAPSQRTRQGGPRQGGGMMAGDDEEDGGYSHAGTVGRNGWVKPDAVTFVDDGPPPEPKNHFGNLSR